MGEPTEAERGMLLVPRACGHDMNDHGSLAGCWTCPDENRECGVTCESLIAAGVERILAARRESLAERVKALADEWDPPKNTYEHQGATVHITGRQSHLAARLRALLDPSETP